MTAKLRRLVLVVAALLVSALVTTDASAQCCGMGGYHTAYYGGYTANYGGWYPGYWMNRIRTRLWGSPTTYVAAYPGYSTYGTHAVGYAGVAPTYATYAGSAGCCSPHTVGYAPCSTCVQQVSLSPVGACESCPTGCSPCASCPTSAVVQAGYVQQAQPGCATCGASAPHTSHVIVTPPANGAAPQQVLQAPTSQPSGAPPATGLEQPPGLGPTEGESERTYKDQKPVNGIEQSTQPGPALQPSPGSDTTTPGPTGDAEKDNSTYFEAPKLFNPKDRTAGRSIAPVRTALYEQPASMHQISAQRSVITAEQAQQDAAGWTSVSN